MELSMIQADVDESPSRCYADEMADTGRGTSNPDVPSFPEHLYLINLIGSQRYGNCWLALGCFWVLKDKREMNGRCQGG